MNRLLPILAFVLASNAHSQGIIGTRTSFASSIFCKTYACQFISRDTLSSNLIDYRYLVRKNLSGKEYDVISVVRNNMFASSIGFVMGIQDTPFSSNPSDYFTTRTGKLIELSTGVKLSNLAIFGFYQRCEAAQPKEIVQIINNGSKKYSLVCSLSGGEFEGANRFYFRIY